MAASSHHHFPKENTLTTSGLRWRELNKKVEIQTSKYMKTKMKRQGSTELPRFAVGALAIAGASAANGAMVQISFANNYVSSSTGATFLETDLTGDGIDEIFGDYANNGAFVAAAVHGMNGARLIVAYCVGTFAAVELGGGWDGGAMRSVDLRGISAPISFTDSRINGGAATFGLLDLSGHAPGGAFAEVQINRLIFDDESTSAPTGVTTATTGLSEWGATSAVPEASTSLGLLALGAGSLLTRRRQKRAA